MSNTYFTHSVHPHAINHSHNNNNHHGNRRRAARVANNHNNTNSNKQLRAMRSAKDAMEAAAITAYRQNFEAARSFELEDDEMFCPFNLLTEDDLHSIHSSGSDRSSLSSGSPDQSPLQQQLQPTPAFMLSSTLYPHYAGHTGTKLHQPLAQRIRNPIPIVDPTTRSVASPPPSVSPARQMMGMHRISA